VIVDLGTGDGRAVLARARSEPRALVIGIDASAAAMAETSRRASRRGPSNALFFAEGAERLADSPLAGRADLLTVTFPWGSLLRGLVGLDPATLAGAAALLRGAGRLEVLASVVPSDRVPGLDCLDDGAATAIREAWRAAGLELTSMRPATPAEIGASGSSWAGRLQAAGHGPRGAGSRGAGSRGAEPRPVWRLDGHRLG
jgi:16S rRNA (adenine(1408)-N(1))-methyltransferase